MSANGSSERPLGISVLGSTGSIGRQTLDVIDAHPSRFRVVALAARARSEHFCAQVARYRPCVAATAEAGTGPLLGADECVDGIDGLIAAATHPAVDLVVIATSGHDAIEPTIRAIEHGKTIALANKEALVCAGEIIMSLAASHGTTVRPVDSEHSAIWQALGETPSSEIRRIFITASGGPFRSASLAEMERVSPAEALEHPTWNMGDKITIDSATMMNKGLEVIEAHWLFGLRYDQIEVLVHPESVVHSLVEFVDGSQIAQLGLPDMRLPIQYALTYPQRLPRFGDHLDLAKVGRLHFEPPNEDQFPCLRLAREAGIAGGTYPTALSAADEEAVAAFMNHLIRFVDIPAIVEDVLECHVSLTPSLQSIREVDETARLIARESIAKRCSNGR